MPRNFTRIPAHRDAIDARVFRVKKFEILVAVATAISVDNVSSRCELIQLRIQRVAT